MEDTCSLRVLCGIEIDGHLSLTINHDLIAGQLFEVDMHHQLIICQITAVMGIALARHAIPDTRLF